MEVCIENDQFRAVCLDEYDDCVTSDVLTEPECRFFAEETCTI